MAFFDNEASKSRCLEPIAVVGMGCRWPGGVSNTTQLWNLLAEKKSGYSNFEKDRLNIDGFLHSDPQRPGSLNTKGGYFLKEDPRLFDHSFFGITPIEARSMDPAQRKLLEVVYEAFENSGEPWHEITGSQTGVYIGNFNSDHSLMQLRDPDYSPKYATTGGDVAILSNRVNYVFDLKGPSVTLNTACSSSMYALHLAVNAIRNGDCESAIVAGTNLILGPDVQMLSVRLGALSATSTCHTFDASADGYARAEGFGCLYLKPLSKALAGDYPVRSVIRGTAVNSNGRTSGISHPSPEGQEQVIRKAYENAGGLDPDLTGYFECHGTGTPVGDPIEVAAIGQVFGAHRQVPLLIGSVKTNLGHSESASGIAAIMKATLAIERGLIPPSIGLEKLNPNIDLQSANARIVTELTPWPDLPVRRISINSFGYGGANAHCILEHVSSVVAHSSIEYPTSPSPSFASPQQVITNHVTGNGAARLKHPAGANGNSLSYETSSPSSDVSPSTNASSYESDECLDHPSHLSVSPPKRLQKSGQLTRRLVLLPFSAHNEQSLLENIQRLRDIIDQQCLSDVGYTLCTRRSRFAQRAFSIVEDCCPSDGMAPKQIKYSKMKEQPSRRIAWIFTGQGAQWVGMGKELLDFAVFKRAIRYQDFVLSKLSNSPSWTIEDVLASDTNSEVLEDPTIAQTVCTALQVALVNLLRSWNIQPAAVVGHSSGEIAAAYGAGRHTAAEAIVLAYSRGRALAENKRKGRMLAVGLSYQDVQKFIGDQRSKVRIAAVNSPDSVTLSGDEPPVSQLLQTLEDAGVFVRALETGGNAYHSHHMSDLGTGYEKLISRGLQEIADVIAREPCTVAAPVPWSSTVHADLVSAAQHPTSQYWRENLESPVLFAEALRVLYRAEEIDIDTHMEIGPHPALRRYIKQTHINMQHGSSTKNVVYLKSLSRGEDALYSMLELAGTLFQHDFPIDLGAVNAVDRMDQDDWYLGTGSMCTDLPPYAFNYDAPLYAENRLNYEWRLRKHLRHDLLGARLLGTAKGQPAWRNVLSISTVSWLADHKLLPSAAFPAAGFMAMAMEAASQIHSEMEEFLPVRGFSLRNLSISSTLKIPDDDEPVEVVLSMQASSLSASKSSSRWKDFRISSTHGQGETWSEHCLGQICVETSDNTFPQRLQITSPLRRQQLQPWYKKFAEKGIAYGPSFSCMKELQVQRDSPMATAQVPLNNDDGMTPENESKYPVHPASIDMCLQLALIACHYGRVESMKTAFVPIFAHKLSLWIPKHESQLRGWGKAIAHGALRGFRGAHCNIQLFDSSDSMILDINDLRCVTYQGGDPTSAQNTRQQRSPYFRLVWKPLLSFLSNESCRTLFPPVTRSAEIGSVHKTFQRLATHMICQFYTSYPRFFAIPYPEPHRMFLGWVERTFRAAISGDLPFGTEATKSSESQRADMINEIVSSLSQVVEVKLAMKMYDSLPAILDGKVDGLQVALRDDLLFQLYNAGMEVSAGYQQLERVIDLLAHENPHMTILEIGAGTGGATRHVLKVLAGNSSFKRYNSYTFTDITPSFLASAEMEFSDCTSMQYAILDVEKDVDQQGFGPVYDLVIASQSLHAASDTATAVRNARSLLRAGGKMILLEMTRTHPLAGIILGTLPSYWKTTDDSRVDSPFLSQQQWNDTLATNGFSGCDFILDDHPEPYRISSVIITSAVEATIHNSTSVASKAPVHVVAGSTCVDLVQTLCRALRLRGIEALHVPLGVKTVPDQARIIFLADRVGWPLLDNDERLFSAAKSILLRGSSILWVTNSDIIDGSQPTPVSTVGLLQTVAREQPASKLLCLDLKPNQNETIQEMADLILTAEGKLVNQTVDDAPFEAELAWHDGMIHASRLVPDQALSKRFNQHIDPREDEALISHSSKGAIMLDIEQPGLLGSLYFRPSQECETDLKHDWIEIKTCAAGVNFKDLAVLSGRVDVNDFGLEASGVVSKVGEGVTRFAKGDRVYGPVCGKFGTYFRCPAAQVERMPSHVLFTEAASVPIVYMTAVYAFIHIARLGKGQSVLIQSASGGVGLAAIQVAFHLGAEIFATVGSISKRDYLVQHINIPADRIFVTRNQPVAAEMMKATNGHGFDVILCSAAGEMLEDAWNCIASSGHLVDIGRQDVLDHGKLSLEIFRRNATVSSFDLSTLCSQRPEIYSKHGVPSRGESRLIWHRIFTEVSELLAHKIVKPIDNIKAFDVSEIHQALTYFSKGTHIGKIVISYEDPETLVKFTPFPVRRLFDSEANYLFAGGLGGLGQSLSIWLVEHGVRHLNFLSRSKSTNTHDEFLEYLRKLGAQPAIVQCDITQRDQVLLVVQQMQRSRPVKGVINAAAVMNDKLFEDSSFEDINLVLKPKIQGTINLDEAVKGCQLDFFVMISSAITFATTAFQGAYNMANRFLDNFARQRQQRGLPAQSISLSLVTEVGMASQRPDYEKSLNRNGLYGTGEVDTIQLLEAAFLPPPDDPAWAYDPLTKAHLILGFEPQKQLELRESLDNASDPYWYSDARMSIIRGAIEDRAVQSPAHGSKPSTASVIDLRSLAEEAIEKKVELCTTFIIEALAKLLYITAEEIDPSGALSSYGMDSMVAAEMRNGILAASGVVVPFLEMLDARLRVQDLVQMILDGMD